MDTSVKLHYDPNSILNISFLPTSVVEQWALAVDPTEVCLSVCSTLIRSFTLTFHFTIIYPFVPNKIKSVLDEVYTVYSSLKQTANEPSKEEILAVINQV